MHREVQKLTSIDERCGKIRTANGDNGMEWREVETWIEETPFFFFLQYFYFNLFFRFLCMFVLTVSNFQDTPLTKV